MSKKMMKRSLVLGALMAFVITGQAWAAKEVEISSGEHKITETEITITSDEYAGALYVTGTDTKVNVTESVTISATSNGANAAGVFNDSSNIEFANNANITTEATNGIARAVDLSSDKSTNVTFKGDAVLTASGRDVQGVYVSGHDDSMAKFEKGLYVNVNGTRNAYGVVARNGASIYAGPATDVKITATGGNGNDACGVYNEVGTPSLNANKYNGGKVQLLGNVEITATSTGSALPFAVLNYNCVGANANANALPETVIGSEGSKVVINGNVVAHSGTIEINLGTNDSKLTGIVGNTYCTDDVGDGTVTLNFAEGATWNVTGDSEVAEIAGDGGVIAVEDSTTRVIVAKDNATDLTVQKADKTADEYTAETAQVELTALDEVVKTDQGEKVADVVAIAEGNIVGAYVLDENGKAVETVNTTNQSIGEAAVAMKSHWRAHMNDMNKRMGELRMANGETGVWTRMVRGETEYQGAKAQYNQYQLGYDEKLSTDKRWTVGAAVTFAEGEGSFGKGTTEDDSTAFAIYGSKLNNDGTFVDLIARYAHMESDVTVGADKADYDVNGYSVSAEFGKRIQQGKGFWIEPQVELTYGSVDSAEYVIGGKTVQVGDMDSLIGRVGFRLGKDIEKGNVYARASYLYDFDGETESTFGNGTVTRTIEEDLGGGWWEVGVGANINLSKATYIYADVEKTFGGEVDTNWQWNLGVRYSF